MTLLRAVFVVIATWAAALGAKMPWAKKLNPVACENALSLKELRHDESLARYDLFLESFKPWAREDTEIVGRAGPWDYEDPNGVPKATPGAVEWRVDLANRRMRYVFHAAAGDWGRLQTARRIAKAALAAFQTGGGLDDFAVEAADGIVTTTLPLNVAGVAFVIDAFNEARAFSGFKPIPFDRRVFTAREIERDGCTRFAYDEHRELTVTECARAAVSTWLEGQNFRDRSAGVNFDPLEGRITIDLPTPRGMTDVLAHARRVTALMTTLARAGLAVDVRTAIPSEDAVRVILPSSPAGLDFLNLLPRDQPPAVYDAPVLIEDLTELELVAVGDALEGLSPRVAYARTHPQRFLRAKPRVLTGGRGPSARTAGRAETVPADMRRIPSVERAALVYGAFGPWTSAGVVWTARHRRVDVVVNPRSLTFDLDFTRVPEGKKLVDAIVQALRDRPGRLTNEGVRVLDEGRRLEVPLGPTAIRVLMETREVTKSEAPAPANARSRRGSSERRDDDESQRTAAE